MRRYAPVILASVHCAIATIAAADVFPRLSNPEGTVISHKSGEEARFVDSAGWKTVDVKQDLLAGDVLRTNAIGHLAILFYDRTQIRLGRNTTLRVKKIGSADGTELGLESGTIWARAERGGEGITVETPAAAAAIRGTDWTMTVEGDGKTSLIVLEGLIEFSNAYGSVSVAGGEAAVASIGQAPTKIIVVAPDDREQMLFYLSLRGAFAYLPASSGSASQNRARHKEILAIAPERRSGEDWTSLAETALTQENRTAAEDAVLYARSFRLDPAQRARLDLVEALIAGATRDYDQAASLFSRAAPHLGGNRRAIALFGGYFARGLADPQRVEAPPRAEALGPYGALAAAIAAGFLTDIKAAITVLQRAEARFPDSPVLPAIRARLAILLDDREQTRAAIDRALALDPDEPQALAARATYRHGIESDLEGARADLLSAVELEPGSSDLWNLLGSIENTRGAEREAEAALRHAISLDPQDPVPHANLAFMLLEQDRIEEAKAEIDTAIALDPEFHIALVARGRYHLQTGDTEKARQDLLAGTTANPAYAQGLILLGSAHYNSGDIEPAEQAFENADRLDPNDPVQSLAVTAIAINDYDAEKAIDNAQMAMKRARARRGDFAPPRANPDASSTLNDAFRLLSLDDWGRYYGDLAFSPFSAPGFVDQAIAGRVDPYVNNLGYGAGPFDPAIRASGLSSFVQGLSLDPLMLAGGAREATLFRRPFIEGSLTGGFEHEGGEWGWTGDAEVRSYSVTPFPWSLSARLNRTDTLSRRSISLGGVDFTYGQEQLAGSAFLTAKPTPNDRLVSYFSSGDSTNVLAVIPTPAALPVGVFDARLADTQTTNALNAGAVWSHTFGYRNIATAGFFYSELHDKSLRERLFDIGVPFGSTNERQTRQNVWTAGVNHSIGVGELSIRYGAEVGRFSAFTVDTTTLHIPVVGPLPVTASATADVTLGRAWIDAIYAVNDDLEINAAVHGSYLNGGTLDVARMEPRIGVSWTPVEGHRLRLAGLRETGFDSLTTLSPLGVSGLQSNHNPLELGGYSDTAIARWEAEWTDRFFTAAEIQHQNLHDISIDIPASLETIDLDRGRLTRASLTANARLGWGFGAFGTVAWTASENRTPGPGFGGPLPYVPELASRFGISFVHPSRLKITVAESYVGERVGDVSGTVLDGYWSTDALLTFEPFDKRFELNLAAYNIFDRKIEVSSEPGGGVRTPGWGRTFAGSLRVRF